MKSRRRPAQKSSVPFGDEGTSDIIQAPTRIPLSQLDRNKRKLKRLRRREKVQNNGLCDDFLVGILFAAIGVSIFVIAFAFVFICSWISNPHNSILGRDIFRNGIELNHNLYHQRYKNTSSALDINNDETQLQDDDPYYLVSYGSEITERGCNITVFLMDPRLPLLENNSPWFTLESVAAFLPDACVVILTARCKIQEEYGISDVDAGIVVFNRMKKAALPLFLKMIEKGQVRISFIDHIKYNLKRCDFVNPSAVLMNIHFWTDEFIEDIDSDTVLIIQDDAVLCHSFDLQEWKQFAFVGGKSQLSNGISFVINLFNSTENS